MAVIGGGRWWRCGAAAVVAIACAVGGVAPGPPATADDGGGGRSTTIPGDDWVVASPESHGLDPDLLDDAREYAFADGRNTQGVVVVHAGEIVGEWYAPGKGPDSYGASWSMAKSFTSALVGIALDEGRIPSIDVPMTEYFPEWIGTPRASITLRDVLHMESGLDWDEDYSPSSIADSEIVQMVASQADQLAFAAGRPAEVAPGTRFNYSSGDTMLLSGVIQQATGRSVGEYAREALLDPIGIDPLDWWQDAEGHTLTYCCVDTSSRDFARFGLLYLRGGAWGGEQVVPAAWVDASVTDTANTYDGYGYQWWLSDGGAGIPPYFSARGHDGQYIYVIPSLDLVAVRNGLYGKSECPPVADPNLVYYYPPQGLVPGLGTIGPSTGWSDEQFLGPIVASVTGDPAGAATASAGPAAAAAASIDLPAAEVDPAVCPNVAAPVSTTTSTNPDTTAAPAASSTTSAPVAQPAATAVVATPRLTG